ncbi:MAG TPA: H(+)/Cl(-) exchange transporter ClcA [Phycisphaerales bacterium]|nr:H(+)/Cl(-) exchange transporter ClcA [Phycisphaerales bacterium]
MSQESSGTPGIASQWMERTRAWCAQPGRGAHFVRAGVVGVIAGLLALGFQWALALAEDLRGLMLDRLHNLPRGWGGQWWAWAVLPAVGMAMGCLVGWMVLRFAPDAHGSGIPHVKGVLLHVRKMKWKGLIIVKFIGGVLGVGVGLSMGREGPTVQMGAAVARALADAIRLPSRLVPQLISCGAGAGLAAAFNAPLAGFLFVLEELHREMSSMTFGGALVGALAADVVCRSFNGQLPSFAVHGYHALPLSALPAVAILGVAGGLLGVAFNRSLLRAQRIAISVERVPRWMLPGLAAALCGLVAWWMPRAIGGGHAVAEHLMTGAWTPTVAVMLMLLGVKFLLTVVSYASGAPGGIFAPMLLLGAIAGALVGKGVGIIWEPWAHHLPAFAVIGMAAVFTGSVRAPLTGMVLILEMTANYEQLLALGVACLAAYATAELLRDEPIYEALLAKDMARRGIEAPDGEEPRSVVMGIQRSSPMEGKTIATAGIPRGCLVVAIERAGKELLPHAGHVLLAGDHITVLVPAHETDKALKIVELARQA